MIECLIDDQFNPMLIPRRNNHGATEDCSSVVEPSPYTNPVFWGVGTTNCIDQLNVEDVSQQKWHATC